MPSTLLQKRKIQKYLIMSFIAVLLITTIVLWMGYRKGEEKTSSEVSVTLKKEVNINFKVLEDPLLEELESFEKSKPFDGEVGRENPFLPY